MTILFPRSWTIVHFILSMSYRVYMVDDAKVIGEILNTTLN